MRHLGFVRILSRGQGGAPSLASPCGPPHIPTLAWAFSRTPKTRCHFTDTTLGIEGA